ncbi:MAG: protein kinase family protein [Planctomycetes bacterium]|nr:protein kinase family protein [Planctomycetota bacterium]
MSTNPQPILPGSPPQRRFRPPSLGQSISHDGQTYFIGQQIGQGAFGAVYDCFDEWGNELVAKVMLPKNRSYSEVRDQWNGELTSLVVLRHPNITYVYDAFEFQDTFYLIIEKCSSTLAGLISMPNLHGELWLQSVAGGLLQAIHFIHSAGYVHKDLHAGNVFLLWQKDRMMPDREPVLSFKVGDLGISRIESDLNIFNTVLAQWMLPPEFLDPVRFGTLGCQVDIYHAGLLFLSLLLGRTPEFTRDEILAGKPRQTAEGLSSPFSSAIAKALRRTVDQRTSTALDFWREICPAAIPRPS